MLKMWIPLRLIDNNSYYVELGFSMGTYCSDFDGPLVNKETLLS